MNLASFDLLYTPSKNTPLSQNIFSIENVFDFGYVNIKTTFKILMRGLIPSKIPCLRYSLEDESGLNNSLR